MANGLMGAAGGFLQGFNPAFQAAQSRQDQLALQAQQAERQAQQDDMRQQLFNLQKQQAEDTRRRGQVTGLALTGGLMSGGQIDPTVAANLGYDPAPYITPEVYTALKPPRLSGDMGNLQAMFPNLTPDELYQKATGLKAAGATRLNVGGGEKEFQKGIGKAYATELGNIRESANTALSAMPNLDAAEAFIKGGLETGKLAPAKAQVAALAQSVGVDPQSLGLDRADTSQAFQTVVMKNLLTELAAQKGPQTEGDAQRAMTTFAQLGNTPEANMFAINYARALASRKVDQNKFISDYLKKHGRTSDNFETAKNRWNERISMIPLFRSNPKTGMPVTYYQFMKQAKKAKIPEERAVLEWVK